MRFSVVATIASVASLVNAAPAADTSAATSVAKAVVHEHCTKSGSFAQTFDDGPYEYNTKITDYLKANGNLKATFFVNGNNYDCIYDDKYVKILQALRAEGHQIASHTYNHYDLATLSKAKIQQQLDLLEEALLKIVGLVPAYFRPPYGSYNTQALQVLANYSYNVFTWDVDSGDADGESVSYSEKQYSQALTGNYPKPKLGLSHETIPTTSQKVVPYVQALAKKQGYKQMTVAECVGDTGAGWYKKKLPDSGFGVTWGKRDSTWTCAGKPQPNPN